MATVVSAAIAAMRAKGIASDDILDVVAAIAEAQDEAGAVAAVDSQAERRRAKDRERKRLLTSEWSSIRMEIIRRDGLVCRYCGEDTSSPHIDHVHPLSRGGSNEASNLAVSCERCNLAKYDYTLDELGWEAPTCQ